jgi:hypothetical protein
VLSTPSCSTIGKSSFGRTTQPGANSSDARFTVASSFLSLAIRTQPDAFEPKTRWAMDWCYPVLTGALTGDKAKARMAVYPGEVLFPFDEHTNYTAAAVILAVDAITRTSQAASLFVD